MRNLTLQEKITIKGILSRYGVPVDILVRLTMKDAVWFFWRCTGRSVADYAAIARYIRLYQKDDRCSGICMTPVW